MTKTKSKVRKQAYNLNRGVDGDKLISKRVCELRRGRVIEWVDRHTDMSVLGFPKGSWGPVRVVSCRRVRKPVALSKGGQDAYVLKLAWLGAERVGNPKVRKFVTVTLPGWKGVKVRKGLLRSAESMTFDEALRRGTRHY